MGNGFQPLAPGWQAPVAAYQQLFTSHQSPVTSHQKPVTSHQKPETRNQKPETRNKKPPAMPFNPLLPLDGSLMEAPEMRSQFTGLKTLIDNVPGITAAVVDSVTTLGPGEPATVTVSIIG